LPANHLASVPLKPLSEVSYYETIVGARIALAVSGLAVLALLGSGCSWWYDLNVVNPCPHVVRIETYNDAPENVGDRPPKLSLYLPAFSTTLVGGAFSDPDGHWSLRLVGVATPLGVEEDKLEDETFEIPEALCPSAWRRSASP
jgi:hypothetical protein